MKGKIDIYQSTDGTQINVKFDKDNVWLSQEQLSSLFERDRTVIGRHIRNIFKEEELDEKEVCANFAHTTKHGAIKGKKQEKTIVLYNLDVIISVGYRVKSRKGVHFRQWATRKLKELLIEGYVLNEKRLEQKQLEVKYIKSGIQLLNRTIEQNYDNNNWLNIFQSGLKILDDYDHERLDIKGLTIRETKYPTLLEYNKLVNDLKSEFDSELFGIERNKGFISAIEMISQNINHEDIYPSIEEKAAMLLYLIVKNHAFTDGNKRIAAACFLLFLNKNDLLFDKNYNQLIGSDTLASLTLFIAISNSQEMEIVKRLIISLLNRKLN